jgi:hypothetical protein
MGRNLDHYLLLNASPVDKIHPLVPMASLRRRMRVGDIVFPSETETDRWAERDRWSARLGARTDVWGAGGYCHWWHGQVLPELLKLASYAQVESMTVSFGQGVSIRIGRNVRSNRPTSPMLQMRRCKASARTRAERAATWVVRVGCKYGVVEPILLYNMTAYVDDDLQVMHATWWGEPVCFAYILARNASQEAELANQLRREGERELSGRLPVTLEAPGVHMGHIDFYTIGQKRAYGDDETIRHAEREQRSRERLLSSVQDLLSARHGGWLQGPRSRLAWLLKERGDDGGAQEQDSTP